MPQCSSALVSSKKVAFTLAEVLITLGVIGIVAVLTLPSLIVEHRKQTYVAGLKRAMNTTSNMFAKMQADEEVSDFSSTKMFTDGICTFNDISTNFNGCEDYYGNPSVFEQIIPKYLNVVKICKGTEECNTLYKVQRLVYNSDMTKKPVAQGNISSPVNISGALSTMSANWPASGHISKFMNGYYTNDGMIFYFIPYSYKRLMVVVDVNGEKGPNQTNRDLFVYEYDSNGKIPTSNPNYATKCVRYLMSNGWKMDY